MSVVNAPLAGLRPAWCCTVCGDPKVHARGLCRRHYNEWWRSNNRVGVLGPLWCECRTPAPSGCLGVCSRCKRVTPGELRARLARRAAGEPYLVPCGGDA